VPLNPIAHPLGPPTISGTTITVDLMLQQPTRITRMLMDLTLQRFIADRVFSTGGGVTGGAVVYDMATVNELYLDRDVERVEPGAEFPIVTSQRRVPAIAPVEKWGGKFYFTDEARDRNDQTAFANEVRRLGNTIVRKINQRAVDTIDTAVATVGAHVITISSSASWGDATALAPFSTGYTPSVLPHATFANVQKIGDQDELGLEYDLLLVNPQEATNLRLVYNSNGGAGLSAVLADNGINEMYSSNRVPAGTAYFIASGQVGEMRVEQPLATETSREGAPLMRQRTWVQSSVRPLMFVNNPYAIIKYNGLAA
jgi:hypothetical protein